MNIRWSVGVAVAVLGSIVMLPGIASAHHPEVSSDVYCSNGTFRIQANYVGGGGDRILEVAVEGDNNLRGAADAPLTPGGMTLETNSASNAVYRNLVGADRWQMDSTGGSENFFAISGDYDSVDALADDRLDVQVDQWGVTHNEADQNDNPGTTTWTKSASQAAGVRESRPASVSTSDFWDECGLEICLDGATGVEVLSFKSSDTEDCDPASICIDGDSISGTEFEVNQLTGTGDCGPVRICVDGGSQTVTKFEANQISGATRGSCVPFENPPPVTAVAEVAPVLVVVAEVSPSVDEVVALPSAGDGGTRGAVYTWTFVLGLALFGLAGTTVLLARK